MLITSNEPPTPVEGLRDVQAPCAGFPRPHQCRIGVARGLEKRQAGSDDEQRHQEHAVLGGRRSRKEQGA
ncbi:hypothetical protein Pgy4_21460, partial [Pseudomonas savastanoi pv. glycinea str. race 4]